QLSLRLLGLISVGYLGYSLLILLSVPILVYQTIPIIRAGYDELFTRRKVGSNVLRALLKSGELALGLFWLAALSNVIYWLTAKLLLRVQNTTRQRLSNVFGEQPRFVWMQHGEVEVQVPFVDVQAGDIVVVHPG